MGPSAQRTYQITRVAKPKELVLQVLSPADLSLERKGTRTRLLLSDPEADAGRILAPAVS